MYQQDWRTIYKILPPKYHLEITLLMLQKIDRHALLNIALPKVFPSRVILPALLLFAVIYLMLISQSPHPILPIAIAGGSLGLSIALNGFIDILRIAIQRQ